MKILFFVGDWIKACMKSYWYIVARFCIASARKHFNRRTEAVGDQLFMRSLICMSPLTHILALSLCRTSGMVC